LLRGETVVLGSILNDNALASKIKSELDSFARTTGVSDLQLDALLHDLLTRNFASNLGQPSGVGGLFQIAKYENGSFNMSGFESAKFDTATGVEYIVSLMWDEQSHTWMQSDSDGQLIALESLETVSLAQPSRNITFRY